MNIDLTPLEVYKSMVKTFFFNNLEKNAIIKNLLVTTCTDLYLIETRNEINDLENQVLFYFHQRKIISRKVGCRKNKLLLLSFPS